MNQESIAEVNSMSKVGSATAAVQVQNLHCAYGKTEAVRGLSFTVEPGRCYGLLGRNGAGKSTTIKCLLNLLRPQTGQVLVGGIDPRRDEVAVKAQIGYVPEVVSFHPWMTVENVLDYHAAFRPTWNYDLQEQLLGQFDLDPRKRTDAMSKGMRSQLGLICAVSPQPALLLLDEPTSGLDPIIRREFLQTVIGAYMESDPGRKTVLVSTHLISEWEGLIDEFTIVDKGRALLTMETETARTSCRKIYARWPGAVPATLPAGLVVRAGKAEPGSLVELLTTNYRDSITDELRATGAESIEIDPLSLEDIFVATAGMRSTEEQ